MAKNTVSGKEEQIGFHKGALTTLAKEREEMMKILQIVEQLMQMHIKSLKELGVDLAQAAKNIKSAGPGEKAAKSKPIEDILK
jgi:hypothetical protein